MTILKRNYLSECRSCKMVLRYNETGIHHSYYTVTITEPKIQIKTNVFLNLISVTAKKALIEWIKVNEIKVLNSGIKIA